MVGSSAIIGESGVSRSPGTHNPENALSRGILLQNRGVAKFKCEYKNDFNVRSNDTFVRISKM